MGSADTKPNRTASEKTDIPRCCDEPFKVGDIVIPDYMVRRGGYKEYFRVIEIYEESKTVLVETMNYPAPSRAVWGFRFSEIGHVTVYDAL